jgi:hypothetical protein
VQAPALTPSGACTQRKNWGKAFGVSVGTNLVEIAFVHMTFTRPANAHYGWRNSGAGQTPRPLRATGPTGEPEQQTICNNCRTGGQDNAISSILQASLKKLGVKLNLKSVEPKVQRQMSS